MKWRKGGYGDLMLKSGIPFRLKVTKFGYFYKKTVKIKVKFWFIVRIPNG